MRWLISADLHLSDRPRDAYRFGLFTWLVSQQLKRGVDATFLLGDLTDTKDCHSARLVNKIVEGIRGLHPPVYILKGNHDYTDPNCPFFGFLSYVPGLVFVTEPMHLHTMGVSLVPHYANQADFDAACKVVRDGSTALVHQCFDGSIAETGSRLAGFSLSALQAKDPGAVYGGDQHKPQQVGICEYVGAPYHVRFGDNFTPRVLYVDNGRPRNLNFDTVRKWRLDIGHCSDLEKYDLRQGDQVKINLHLTREETVDWLKQRQGITAWCRQAKVEVFGISLHVAPGPQRVPKPDQIKAQNNADYFDSFCTAENLNSQFRKAGAQLLRDV